MSGLPHFIVLVGSVLLESRCELHFHRKYKQLFFFYSGRGGGVIFLCSYSFWRRSNYFFKQLKGYSFLTRAESIFFFYAVFPAVWSVMSTLLSRRTNSTILEGQMLGTVHIMEGTCSRLRFFVRNVNTDMCIYTYTYTIMYTYIHRYTCTKTSAITRLSGWLCGWVVWCGVVRCVVVVVSLSLVFSNLKLVRSRVSFGEPLKHVTTLCGQFLVSRTVDKR